MKKIIILLTVLIFAGCDLDEAEDDEVGCTETESYCDGDFKVVCIDGEEQEIDCSENSNEYGEVTCCYVGGENQCAAVETCL